MSLYSASSETEPLISSHNRIPSGLDTFFFVPRSFQELPVKKIGAQLESLGKIIASDHITLPSVPKPLAHLKPRDRFAYASEVQRAILIRERFRPAGAIPDVIVRKAAEQAEAVTLHWQTPITIDVGPIPLVDRLDNSSQLLQDLWNSHIDHYRASLSATTHAVVLNNVIDPIGESWVRQPLDSPRGDNQKSIEKNASQSSAVELKGIDVMELKKREQQLRQAWEVTSIAYKNFFREHKLSTWAEFARIVHLESAASHFSRQRSGYGGPQHLRRIYSHSSDFERLKEIESKALKSLQHLGLSELSPKTIADQCLLLSQTVNPHAFLDQELVDIPCINMVVPKNIFDAAIRKIALELAYNQIYSRDQSPIRIMPTDTTVFTRGFERIGMATKFAGAPPVGTLPENETAVLVSSSVDDETRLLTPLHAAHLPSSTEIILSKDNKRYVLPLHLTSQSFKELTAQ